jgi:hypothetical protein
LDCHTSGDVHGDGTEYNSMLHDGAIDADCGNDDCHADEGAMPLPDAHASYDPHSDKIHCTSCHASKVITCYNCHLESQVESHVKRHNQLVSNFVLLVNREKDSKVYPASFQSVTYQGSGHVAFGPFSAHTITKEGRTCTDCHNNANVQAYNSTGEVRLAQWSDTDSTLTTLEGIVPFPPDYETSLKMDFITYNGNTDDPLGNSKDWSSIGKDTWDSHQLMFASALTEDQMAFLAFPITAVEQLDELPTDYKLEQNYPNPFNPSTTIKYSLPQNSRVQLRIYDILGNLVETLVDDNQNAGVYTVDFDGSNLSSGVYFYQLITPQFKQTKKLILMK